MRQRFKPHTLSHFKYFNYFHYFHNAHTGFSMTLFAMFRCFDCLYAIPLILATGMVYSASRHEEIHEVFRNGLRLSEWIAGFMFLTFLIMIFLF